MKVFAVAVTVLALGLGACANQTPAQQRVTTGAAIGALGGAAIGGIAGGGKGALMGAALGGIGGGVVAGVTAPREDCVAYDRYGRPYRAACR